VSPKNAFKHDMTEAYLSFSNELTEAWCHAHHMQFKRPDQAWLGHVMAWHPEFSKA
jgi:hypothetical protein